MTPEQIAAVIVVVIPLLIAIQAYIVALTHQLDKRVAINETKLNGEMSARDARTIVTETAVREQGLAAAAARGRAQRTRKEDQNDPTPTPVQGTVHDNSPLRSDSLWK